MKIALSPINRTQEEFKKLCDLGGGLKGGPARGRVQKLLRASGKSLNQVAYAEAAEHFSELSDRNPWHLCFAIGLCWGHLAKLDLDFCDAATRALATLNDADIKVASKFHYERGPLPIEQSLRGGYLLFQSVKLPDALPTTLSGIRKCQNDWMKPIANKATRPKYIGA